MEQMQRRPANYLLRTSATSLVQVDELEFLGTAATSDLQEDGYALDMTGCDLSRFRAGNMPLLLQHDGGAIVGRVVNAYTTSSKLEIRGRFATPGISSKADEARGLLKDGVINSLSLGFAVMEREPLRGANWGYRAVKWTALEVSLVGVPLDAAALVTARAAIRGGSRAGWRASVYGYQAWLAEREAHIAAVTAAQCRPTEFDRRKAEADRLRRAAG